MKRYALYSSNDGTTTYYRFLRIATNTWYYRRTTVSQAYYSVLSGGPTTSIPNTPLTFIAECDSLSDLQEHYLELFV